MCYCTKNHSSLREALQEMEDCWMRRKQQAAVSRKIALKMGVKPKFYLGDAVEFKHLKYTIIDMDVDNEVFMLKPVENFYEEEIAHSSKIVWEKDPWSLVRVG